MLRNARWSKSPTDMRSPQLSRLPHAQQALTAFATLRPILKCGRYTIRYIRSILSFLEGLENRWK
jgi:hypothetical protein